MMQRSIIFEIATVPRNDVIAGRAKAGKAIPFLIG